MSKSISFSLMFNKLSTLIPYCDPDITNPWSVVIAMAILTVLPFNAFSRTWQIALSHSLNPSYYPLQSNIYIDFKWIVLMYYYQRYFYIYKTPGSPSRWKLKILVSNITPFTVIRHNVLPITLLYESCNSSQNSSDNICPRISFSCCWLV